MKEFNSKDEVPVVPPTLGICVTTFDNKPNFRRIYGATLAILVVSKKKFPFREVLVYR